MHSINVIDGSKLYIHPFVSCEKGQTSYLLTKPGEKPLFVEANIDQSIDHDACDAIIKRQFGAKTKSSLFSNPELCNALFNWDREDEVHFLQSFAQENNKKKLLDVGTGVGQILLPLYKRGVDVWGVEESLPFVEFVNSNLEPDDFRVFCADMADFSIPSVFDLVFSSMNTIRYLNSTLRIKKHLLAISCSLMNKGYYLFNVSLSPDVNYTYSYTWDFTYKGDLHTVTWEKVGYCHNKNLIMDRVSVHRGQDCLFAEYQTQCHLSYATIMDDILSHISGHWEIKTVLDHEYKTVKPSKNLKGKYWFILKKP